MKISHLIFTLFSITMILIGFGGCCSSAYLQDCDCELTADTTEFFLPYLNVGSPYTLDRKYIVEEIKKDSIINWVKNYYKSDNIDGSLFSIYWEKAKSKLKNKDRIFFYSIVDSFGGGVEGIVVVRDCKIVFEVVLISVWA